MGTKRITAMYFGDEDDFPNNANKSESVQNPSKQEESQNHPASSNSNSQLTNDPAKNPVQPEKPQDSKHAPASPAANESELSANLPASTSQTPKPEDQQVPESPQPQQANPNSPKTDKAAKLSVSTNSATQEAKKAEKKKRVKKTDAERLQLLKELRNKKLAGAAQMQKEAAILEQKIAWAEKSPEEKRIYQRDLDAHCKILAGAIAINMFNDKNIKFDRETFKKIISDSLHRPEDISYFKKKLNE